jgi:hypothetical protein
MRSLWWKFKCAPVSHIKKDGGLRLLRQFLTLPVGQCQARHAAQRGLGGFQVVEPETGSNPTSLAVLAFSETGSI